jgi:mono/diheme cytochrome c family protein
MKNTRFLWRLSGAVAASILATTACSKSEPAPTPAASPSPVQQAAPAAPAATATLSAPEIFKTRCAVCHGESGHGDGPGAVALNPKPRNYGDAEWQKTVTDEQIKKTIVEGGAAVGKSPLMVPNPDLAGKEEVLAGLVTIIRDFSGK